MLQAFDRLFAKTAGRLQVSYTPAELAEAHENFAERMAKVLSVLENLPFEAMPPGLLEMMEGAIEELSPAQVVGQVAAIPLLQHSQLLLQRLAHRHAEQQFLEYALEQVDTTYGGN